MQMSEFISKWSGGGSERSDCQTYWNDLLTVLGIRNTSDFIKYEKSVSNSEERGSIDCYIKSTKVLIEMKSSNVSLDAKTQQKVVKVKNGKKGRNPKITVKRTALEQALVYNGCLGDDEKAKIIVTCNFKEIRIYEVDKTNVVNNCILNCLINDFEKNIDTLMYIVNISHIINNTNSSNNTYSVDADCSEIKKDADCSEIRKDADCVEIKKDKTSDIKKSDKKVKGAINNNKSNSITVIKKEKNGILAASRNRKLDGGNNEFYTPLRFIEAELEKHYEYREHFKNKIIYCNCDDPFWSKFYEFFKLRAVPWGLKGLIATSYKPNGGALKLEWYRNVDNIVSDNTIIPRISMLNGDGDFRSEECLELLKKCDIVVTNPPFSSESSRAIYAEFIDCILKYNKQFVIIGNHVKMLNNKILENIVDEKINIGYEFYDVNFHTIIKCDTDEPRIRRQKVCWFTNLELKKENELLKFKRCYKDNEKLYPKYKDYDIIFVDKYENIPSDYMGIMSVPITFLGKYNKKQFRLVCINDSNLPVIKDSKDSILEDGRSVFAHLLVQRIR